MIALAGARVCVTGGARGIGAATAAALVERGATVWIGDRDLVAATATADRLGPRAHAHHLDVTDTDSFAGFIDAASARGPVDMLVNNAGIQHMGRLVDQDLDALQRELDINLGAVLTGTRLVLPGMIERGRGHVVNVSSMAGKITTPGIATYCASKFGVVALSRAVRAELAGTGVTLTTIMPAATRTDLTSGVLLRLQPTLDPAEVAAAIVDSARHGRGEVTVPRYLAGMGVLEELIPSPIMWWLKRFVGGVDYGAFDPARRKAYLDRSRAS
ncbi:MULTISPECIES: SDR family oxidoreductase [unclassified Gordonia (in: high G+C Gram-positive bacteria)]|uniref:SDR family oxidoreductase n=1 Tax=unclassified Gordonia (in: high G+C Gram-positive bacteria) TaxID=2657482 RepID=UPI0013318E6F|nr:MULTISPECIES: SDR family oxidoreductase [unclassified Gordonia (in: high G+C Gram-positive bacteria)]KAF0968408.1 3-phenylpropionate-dihydrodiol/cinnamic acid-dihydrodiol dehydrogenase [Gordonia sp. YY1]MCR8895414.1 SDR family oxidoreductase [Gordonia sp. GONU]